MQDSHFNEMISNSFKSADDFAQKVKTETDNLPVGARTPTPDEISAMKKFTDGIYSKNKNASPRFVRRAVQRQFGLQILPNTGLK